MGSRGVPESPATTTTPITPTLASLCYPLQTTSAFWQTWKEFEVRHGNEDTIREMLRIRRSVQATYNTQVNFMASQMLKVSGSATGTGERPAPRRAEALGRAGGAGAASRGPCTGAGCTDRPAGSPQCPTWPRGRVAWMT